MKRYLTKDETKAFILKMFERRLKPVLIGQVALELHRPLSLIEPLFDELVDERKIRMMTDREKLDHDIIHGYFLCKVVV